MRTKLIAALAASFLVFFGASALATGPSSEDGANNVECDSQESVENPADGGTLIGVSQSDSASQTEGWIEVCSDDDTPLDGRIVAEGSADESGAQGSVCADGENSNNVVDDPENDNPFDGYACLQDGGDAGVELVCGDHENGDFDSQDTEDGEPNAEECAEDAPA